MASPFTMKKAMSDIGQRLSQAGFLAGTDGNFSLKLDDDRILITPSGKAKGRLSPDDMVLVDINGKKIQGNNNPSSEMLMHLISYQKRDDIKAVVHSHPPYATAFAVSGLDLADDILPEVVLFVGKIKLTDYAPPGTDAVPKCLEPFIEECNAFLLRNHGLLTLGRTLEEAYNRHETVEHYAKIVHLARQLGNIDQIPSEDYQRLEKIRQKLDETWNSKA